MSRPRPRHRAASLARWACATLLVLLGSLPAAGPAAGASPAGSPTPTGDPLRMVARPLLGGVVRPGSWTAIRVRLENDGPAVVGELRVSGGRQGDSRYGVGVELPTGARQEHVLYAQPAWFGSRLTVELVADGHALMAQPLTSRAVDQWTPIIVVVAERPQGIVGDLRAGATQPVFAPPVILPVPASELPPRVEAWSAIDRLVWQDVDSSTLSAEQLAALRAWVGAGGRLVVVGGSTGLTTLGSLPADLLPFRPERTVDLSTADLAGLLGEPPASATGAPALAGTLVAGTVLGRAGDDVFAAQRAVGQGVVALVGIDPSSSWLSGSAASLALWRRLLPPPVGGVLNPLALQDDRAVAGTLANLPAVDLPDVRVLLALLLLYIVLIGPVNYLVLRRIDRLEWAWVTMPALVAIFAVAAWALGVRLKGTDTIVNQVGIVRTAAGSDTGIGQWFVGIFSPARATYDVEVSDAALLTPPAYLVQDGSRGDALDVLQGDAARLRRFEVGFAVLRSFRAEAAVAVPHLDADLEYRDGVLTGDVTNRSERRLDQVVVTWGGAVGVLGPLDPGGSAAVSLRVAETAGQPRSLSELVLGPYPVEGERSRERLTRRTVLDQLSFNSSSLGGAGSPQWGPVVLAWAPGPGIGVGVGVPVQSVGDTLLLYPAGVSAAGRTVWPTPLVSRAILSALANEAADMGSQLSLSRGSMVVELRPMAEVGDFQAASLALALTMGELPQLRGDGPMVAPLPDADQPPQDDPLDGPAVLVPTVVGDGRGGAGAPVDIGGVKEPTIGPDGRAWDGIPDLQLFDRMAGRWVELPHPVAGSEFRVADPERYVDGSGSFLVRFVNRAEDGMTTWFAPLVRLEGSVA